VSGASASGTPSIRTFLIADVRGYTAYSQAHGDEAAARLASAFAEIAREGVEAYGGDVIELRGDEALAVFASARQALRAAVELQQVFVDEMQIRPNVPLRVGMGLDAGEAVPVEGGYRGGALNLAARLCSQAPPGAVLASQGVVHLARAVPGLRFEDAGALELKGLGEPVPVLRVLPDDSGSDPVQRLERLESQPSGAEPPPAASLPEPLGALTSLVGRASEARRLRWEWRSARRGGASLILIAGAAGLGKTRLAAEPALLAAADGASILYASGREPGDAARALAQLGTTVEPTLIVVDDLEAASADDLASLSELAVHDGGSSLLVVGTLDEQADQPGIAALISEASEAGRLVRLAPLDASGVAEIAASYGVEGEAVPVERILQESAGRPARVHRAVAEWIREAATSRLAESVSRTTVGWSDLREHEDALARNVVELQLARERLQTFDAAVGRAAECPYMGLASFDVDDAELFYGRERLVAELVTRLARTTLVGVVGPSGSGKSSAVRAGLVPTVAAGVLPGSADWTRILLRPGGYPLRELDRAVWAALPDRHRSALAGTELPLRGVRDLLAADERILLVVDQFEEAYTLCGDEAERQAFVNAVVEAAHEPGGRISVVLAIRADYYGRCASDPELARLLGANHVLVGPMSAEEYRRAIEQPAQRVGLRVDPPLVDALVADVVDEPGALPLLSTALVELWHRREGASIPIRAYLETGGVSGAVARLAEEAYASLSERQRDFARNILLRLTGSGEGEAVVRRRAPLSEFDSDDADVAHVLKVLTDDRLVTLSEGSVEVAHEALLREWPRLRDWVDEDREGRRLREHLIVATRDWEAAGRDPGELYRGARLGSALDWTADHTLELNELERSFLAESRAASEEEAERQRRTNRRLRGLLIGAGVLLVVALAAGAVALAARNDAQDSATAATAQRLGAQALVVKDIDLSLLLARQAVEIDDSPETLANLESALVRAPEAIRVSRPLPGRLLAVDASDDGRWVGYGNNDAKLAFVDASTGHAVRIVDGSGWGFLSGDEVVVGRDSPDRISLFKIDLGSGAESPWGTVRKPPDDEPWFFSITDDSRISALLPPTGEVTLRYVRTGRVLRRFRPAPGATPFSDVNFRGRYLVITSIKGPFAPDAPAHFEIWRVDPWRLTATVDDPRGNFPFTLDKAGRQFAVGHRDGSVTVWDVTNGTSRDLSGRHNAAVQGIGFSQEGTTLVTTGDDAQVLVWDVATGELRQTLTGHTGRAFGPGFSPDGKTLYTVGLDGAAITWDLDGSRLLGRPFEAGAGHEPSEAAEPTSHVAVSPDGRRAAVPQDTGGIAVVDLRSGRRLFVASPPAGKVLDVAWSPDGEEIATGAVGGELEIWNAGDGSRVQRNFRGTPAKFPPGAEVPPDATNDVHAIAYSPDGTQLAGALSDGRVLRWDAATGKPIGEPLDDEKYPEGAALDLAFSSEGDKLAAAIVNIGDEGGVAIVWSLPDGKELYRANIDDGYGRGSAVAFTPDGQLLATGGGSGEVKFWHAATGERAGNSLTGTAGWVMSLEFDPTGELLVSGGTDGVTRLWDVPRRAPFGTPLPGLENIDLTARLTPDGKRVVAVYSVGQGFVWQLEADEWKRQACAVAGRTLTEREWELYLPGEPYDPACAD